MALSTIEAAVATSEWAPACRNCPETESSRSLLSLALWCCRETLKAAGWGNGSCAQKENFIFTCFSNFSGGINEDFLQVCTFSSQLFNIYLTFYNEMSTSSGDGFSVYSHSAVHTAADHCCRNRMQTAGIWQHVPCQKSHSDTNCIWKGNVMTLHISKKTSLDHYIFTNTFLFGHLPTKNIQIQIVVTTESECRAHAGQALCD